ncbi:MAG: N-acetyltransferase [Flavobacteriaceae bacterium]|jgi:predicted GNAT family acetyltransferase|tara:strand:+ start:1882 stop:2178 length:297 start_codon:yes stop_codon:yes gene_type:complete
MVDASNLIDNVFLRQYELKVGGELATLEYSQQERKIFLTKLNIPDVLMSEAFLENFLKIVLENIIQKDISVVPTSPPVAKFIRRNRRYRKMLPVGIRI